VIVSSQRTSDSIVADVVSASRHLSYAYDEGRLVGACARTQRELWWRLV